MRRLFLGGFAVCLAGCGLDQAGQLQETEAGPDVVVILDGSNDRTVVDAPVDSPVDLDASDGGTDASDGGTDASDAGTDASDAGADASDAGCPLTACTVANVPGGWEPIAYQENTGACPATFNGTAYVTNPTVGGSTCTCGCSLTQNPVCDVGTSQTYFSNAAGCGSTGQALTFGGSGCLNFPGGNLANFYKSTALPVSGGACTAAPVTGSAVETTAESCAPTVCKEDICAGNVPATYAACIETPGDQACPGSSPFTVKHLIGTNTNVSCSNSCSCAATGTCSAPKIAFYSDNSCTSLTVTLASDNTCIGTGSGGSFVSSGKYSATLTNPTCTKGGSTTATLDLQNKRTICCRP